MMNGGSDPKNNMERQRFSEQEKWFKNEIVRKTDKRLEKKIERQKLESNSDDLKIQSDN